MNYFRKSVLALMLATLASNAMADDVITLSTSKPVGEKMTLMVNPIGEISIAWGDDVFITYPTTDQPFRILESELKGQTITIKAADNRITMLNCSNQEVTSIDVTQAPNLRSLYCHNNKLEKVALSKADKLTDLDLSKNTFSSTKITVTAKTHPMMEAINLADNDFASNGTMGNFNFTGKNLQRVDISNNAFVKVNFQNATLFDALFSANNKISTLDLEDYATLTTLYAPENQIKTLKVADANALQTVVVPSNELTSIDLSGSADLKTLNVANNELTNITLPNAKLTTFDCANNKLTFGSFPVLKYKPENYNITPQAPLSIAGLMKMTDNNVPYIDVCPSYDDRNKEEYILNISDYREGPGHSSSGVVVKAFRINEAGEEVELTKVSSTAKDNEYSYSSGKLVFFKPMTNVFIKLTNSTYKELELVSELFCVGKDVAVGIDDVCEPLEELQIVSTPGALTLTTNKRTLVNIFNIEGKKVWGGTVIGAQTIYLPKGVFVVNGKKVNII
ncbi:MAG: hypothetical protein J6R79_05360 [Bacteroidaceae bacterium]|nr:hypothetical protein [Bacteroidaceae bacterium]